MIHCGAALGRIHQEIIETLPHSDLRFVLHEAYDADGQDGRVDSGKCRHLLCTARCVTGQRRMLSPPVTQPSSLIERREPLSPWRSAPS